jgi:hypothetical protein
VAGVSALEAKAQPVALLPDKRGALLPVVFNTAASLAAAHEGNGECPAGRRANRGCPASRLAFRHHADVGRLVPFGRLGISGFTGIPGVE